MGGRVALGSRGGVEGDARRDFEEGAEVGRGLEHGGLPHECLGGGQGFGC